MTNLASSSNQQPVVSTELVVATSKMNKGKVEEERQLYVSETAYLSVCSTGFFGFISITDSNYVVKESIVRLTYFETWVGNILTCLEGREERDWHIKTFTRIRLQLM